VAADTLLVTESRMSYVNLSYLCSHGTRDFFLIINDCPNSR